jgi:hypothetical protein
VLEQLHPTVRSIRWVLPAAQRARTFARLCPPLDARDNYSGPLSCWLRHLQLSGARTRPSSARRLRKTEQWPDTSRTWSTAPRLLPREAPGDAWRRRGPPGLPAGSRPSSAGTMALLAEVRSGRPGRQPRGTSQRPQGMAGPRRCNVGKQPSGRESTPFGELFRTGRNMERLRRWLLPTVSLGLRAACVPGRTEERNRPVWYWPPLQPGHLIGRRRVLDGR